MTRFWAFIKMVSGSESYKKLDLTWSCSSLLPRMVDF